LNTNIGCKFYKYHESEDGHNVTLEILRLKKIKNQDCYILRNELGKEIRLNNQEFKTYTKLSPDGFVTFSIVQLRGSIEDIIVTMHRCEDIQKSFIDPYCVCRQNIFNLFANQIIREDDKKVIGCCMSIDTCPKDVNYQIMVSCNSTRQTDVVSIYLDDSLEEVMSFINPLNFNDVLDKFYKKMNDGTMIGVCKNLKELLEYNDFWLDVQNGFGISRIPFVIEKDKLEPEQKEYIEGKLKHIVLNELIVIYDKDIDLDNIQRHYILLSDPNSTTYVMTYVKGDYINREYDKLEDQSEKELLLNIGK